jgi:hypothetical protein
MIYDKKYVTQNMAFLTIAIVGAVFFLNQFWEFYQDNTCIVRTYSRNLLEGNGLIWINGERVEGCTQFLWVVLIAVVYLTGKAKNIPKGRLCAVCLTSSYNDNLLT